MLLQMSCVGLVQFVNLGGKGVGEDYFFPTNQKIVYRKIWKFIKTATESSWELQTSTGEGRGEKRTMVLLTKN